MTTTPKGYTELTNASAMSGPEQINDAERFVEDLIGESVETLATLPTSGNWVGRTILVAADGLPRICTALPNTWSQLDADTGWIPLSFTANWASFSPGTWGAVAYRRRGSRGTLRGVPVPAAGAANIMGTLPLGFRPQFDEERLVWTGSTVTKLILHADGAVEVVGALSGAAISLGELDFTVS